MVFIIRNFLSETETKDLNRWVDEAMRAGRLDPGADRGFFGYDLRYTSRFCKNKFWAYDATVYSVRDRITDVLSLHDLGKSVAGGGKDGIVVSCTKHGGDVYPHQDPKEGDGMDVLRCNVMSRKPELGGKLYVGEHHIDIDAGDLHCYLASDVQHYVTTVSGPVSRVLWMFGYQIAKADWEKRRKEFLSGK
jgi:hypothetical protein